jgi:hypothetical protein
VAWADVDGDGDLDGIVASERNPLGGDPPARNRLLRNDGSGRFEDDRDDLTPASSLTHAVAAGDLDGDGDIDVFLGNSDSIGLQNEIRCNDGTGVFGPGPALPLAADGTEDVLLADLDGDLDLDAVVANDDDFQNRLLLNDGGAVFTDESARLPVQGLLTLSLAGGDVDADGDLDIVLGNRASQQNRLFRNTGDGHFVDASLPTVADSTRCVVLFDRDGDGDRDLLAINDQQDQLHANDGTGAFTAVTAQALPAESDRQRWAAVGDVDLDGDVDIVRASGSFFGRNELLRNEAGTFVSRPELLPDRAPETIHVSLADVDGDGDLDLFHGTNTESTATDHLEDLLLVNLTRQLAWRAPPRAGKRLELELAGRPFAPYQLNFAPARAVIPLAGLGTLFLDPATMERGAAGRLDARGRARAGFLVPADIGLIGSTTYWQALLAGPRHLTNLELTTVTGD